MDSYRQEVEEFEAIRSDWQMEKESLEGVLMKLRSELKTRDDKLNATHLRKVIRWIHFCVKISVTFMSYAQFVSV